MSPDFPWIMSCTSTIANATLPENSFYVGINLQDILYGIQLVLYFKTMYILVARRTERQKSDVFYAVFSTVMLLLITIWVASEGVLGQKMWLPNINYPGGPLAYAEGHMSDTLMNFATTAILLLQQMANGFMVYRCRIAWDSLNAIRVVPIILWLINLVLGILASWDAATPNNFFFSVMGTTKLGLAYCSISVFLSATLTCMISYWLVYQARRDSEDSEEENGSPSFNVVGLLVESMLPYTLSGIAFLIAYGVGSGTKIAFSCVYALMMCVSPQMLILRVVEGRAWEKDKPPTSIMFSPDTTSGVEGAVMVVHLERVPSK